MISYFPHFEFASAPRTGTAWFVQAAALAGLGERTRGNVHLPHEDGRETLTVSVVRHPCDWLASYYTALKVGHVGVPCVDVFRQLQACSFDAFIEEYLETLPGEVGRMMLSYNASTYLRLEDMPLALFDLLAFANVSRSKRLTACSHARANRCLDPLPTWKSELWDAVVDAEFSYVEKFEFRRTK